MEEPRSFGAAGDSSSSRTASSFEVLGDRTRFTVELRPAETTIVSWKKLMKDASRSSNLSSTTAVASVPEPPSSQVNPLIESRLAPGEPAPNDLKSAAPPNRFSAVVEKIERLYTGKDSSDDGDHDDILDEDQYDTEDSFIDDAELDEYFEVDKIQTKHDGFFVNRGKLQSIEPSLSPTQQPKKRRRKAMLESSGVSDGSHAPNKRLKMGIKGGDKTAVQNNSLLTSLGPSGAYPQEIVVDKKPTLDAAASLKHSNGDAAKILGDKLKEASEYSDPCRIKYYGDDLDEQKEKNGHHDQIDLNVAAVCLPAQNLKSSHFRKREGCNLKLKGNVLDKAIKDLEKMVAESRPPAADFQDPAATYQGTKRRLPREIKQKLDKVARVAHMIQGEVSEELLHRLMSILGHLINLRTLKRNLKIMISTSLSVNQEKDYKFQQTKNEIVAMITAQGPILVHKDQQPGSVDDSQESRPQENRSAKLKTSIDAELEDKICDLYDIFIDGLDDDVAPKVRKLYAELAELWPKGVMDNHGIKRAICRAKDRRRILHDSNKDQERMKKKKLVAVKVEETTQADSTSAGQPPHTEAVPFENLSAGGIPSYQSNLPCGVDTNNTTASTSISLSLLDASSYQNCDWSKLEKVSHTELRSPNGALMKKSEINLEEVPSQPDDVGEQGEETQKSDEQQTARPLIIALQNSSFQLDAPPNSEQLT